MGKKYTEIAVLYILEKYRGKGIGKELFETHERK